MTVDPAQPVFNGMKTVFIIVLFGVILLLVFGVLKLLPGFNFFPSTGKASLTIILSLLGVAFVVLMVIAYWLGSRIKGPTG